MHTQMTTPELYRQRDSLYAEHARAEHPDQKASIKREMTRLSRQLNRRGLPSKSDDYRTCQHLWTKNFDFLTSLKAHVASDKPIAKWQFVEAAKRMNVLPGHTYRVYAHWKRFNDGHKVFIGLVAWDNLSLSTPGSCYTKLGTIEL